MDEDGELLHGVLAEAMGPGRHDAVPGRADLRAISASLEP
jgi:hypothetical protein